MAGPIYYADLHDQSDHKFPDYFNGKLFIYDWVRGWVKLVTMDEEENFLRMEPFMPAHQFANPIDMQFARDGSLYVLEYGTTWYRRNEDARIKRIRFNRGNRAPIVAMAADREVGPVPLTVQFDATETIDYDKDALSFRWDLGEGKSSTEPKTSFTFEQPGVYEPTLTVVDGQGNEVTSSMIIVAGNSSPQLQITIEGNQSLYWDDREIAYQVTVEDEEDETIDPNDIIVTTHYLPEGYDETEITLGHQQPVAFLEGKQLMDGSDCKACHQMNQASIGPSYLQIAEKYKDVDGAVAYLGNKIKVGGGGVWGEQGMAAHPQLSVDETQEIAQYILSLNKEAGTLPPQGFVVTSEHKDDDSRGRYFIKATYTDKGNGDVPAISASEVRILEYHRIAPIDAEEVDEGEDWGEIVGDDMIELWEDKEDDFLDRVEPAGDGTIIHLGSQDLAEIRSVSLDGYLFGPDSELELFLDGESIGSGKFVPRGRSEFAALQRAAGTIPVKSSEVKGQFSIRVNAKSPGETVALFRSVRFNP